MTKEHRSCTLQLVCTLSLLLSINYETNAQCTSDALGTYSFFSTAKYSDYADASFSVSEYARDLPTDPELCGDVSSLLAESGDTLASTPLLFDECSTNCQESDIPILAGTGFFGFNLEDAIDVCFESSSTMDKATEDFCKTDDATICPIAEASEGVVSSMTQFDYGTLAKASELRQLVDQAREQALDPENSRLIQLSTASETPGVIRGIYADILQDFGTDDDFQAEKLVSLKSSFESLKATVDSKFGPFKKALDDCNKAVPRTDTNLNIIHDVCSQKSTKCIEDDEAAHVSCCCVYNPISQMPGLSVSGTSDPASCSFFDICSETLQTINDDVAAELNSQIDDSLYQEFKTNVEREYGDYFQETKIQSRPVAVTPRPPAVEFVAKQPTGCDASIRFRDTDSGYTNARMIYDFEGAIQDNHCTDRFGNSNAPMYARCEDFCGGDAVPLLVGTGGSPVSLNVAKDVCFHSSIVGPASDESFCRGQGQTSLRNLKEKLAEFVSLVMIFRTGKLLFLGVLAQYSAIIREKADSQELRDIVQNSNSGAEKAAYVGFFKPYFDFIEEQEEFLVELAGLVKKVFEELETLFDSSYDDLLGYTQRCSQTFPRTVGQQSVGTQCADESESYVYCCCASNPTISVVTENAIDTCTAAKSQASEVYNLVANEGGSARREGGDGGRREGGGDVEGPHARRLRQAEELFDKAKASARRLANTLPAASASSSRRARRADDALSYFKAFENVMEDKYGEDFVRPVTNAEAQRKKDADPETVPTVNGAGRVGGEGERVDDGHGACLTLDCHSGGRC